MSGTRSGEMVGGLFHNSYNDEFSGPNGCDSDEAYQSTLVEILLGHRCLITFYEERFIRLDARQGAMFPLLMKKIFDHLSDLRPQRLFVRLKGNPREALSDA